MRIWIAATAAIVLSLAVEQSAHAAALQVSPVTVELRAPKAASLLTLRNPGSRPLKAQIRVFRWSQGEKGEVLEPTTDVVASPPMASVQPGEQATVRLVRLSKGPVAAEETYRIIVDELPEASSAKTGMISLAFRYSIPVFVSPAEPGKPDLAWSFKTEGGKTVITAVNSGTRRIRLADFQVKDAKGKEVTLAKGLAGYVLARSSMSWVAPSTVQAVSGAPLLITAQGDQGAINAEVRAQAAK